MTAAFDSYIKHLNITHASGAGADETSSYGILAVFENEVSKQNRFNGDSHGE